MAQIKLNLKDNSYPVVVGFDLDDKLIAALKKSVKNGCLFVFYDSQFFALHGNRLSKKLKKQFKALELVIPSSEKAKSITNINKLHDYLLSENISRTDFILACGGGVTSDLVGYTAATVLRGVRWGILSTTLLGMVDASIGGKTGINHKSGKNLIGAFHQPSFVVCDLNYLMTLSEREMMCGLGEIVKYAGLIGEPMISALKSYLNKDLIYNKSALLKLVKLSAQYKAEIVEKDERESNLRMLLNFGHTVGHAIEKEVGYGKILHGEAVLFGLWVAVELSMMRYGRKKRILPEYQKIIESFITNLPTYKLSVDNIIDAMKSDKKRINSKRKFILLKSVGSPIIVDGIDTSNLQKAIRRMLDFYNTRS